MARMKMHQNASHTWTDDGALVIHLDDLGMTKSEHYRFEPTTDIDTRRRTKLLVKLGFGHLDLVTRGKLTFTGGVQIHGTGLYKTTEIPSQVEAYLDRLGFDTDADAACYPDATRVKTGQELRESDLWWV